MYLCKKCNNSHEGSYGSGSFCSEKCARSYSRNIKREETNLKISKTLSSKKANKISDSKFIEVVKHSESMAEAARILNIPFSTFKRRAKKMNLYNPSMGPLSKPKKKRLCNFCNKKEITSKNISGYCISCFHKVEDERKIKLWLETGDTSNKPGGNIKNGIRKYIYNEQDYKCAICKMERIWNNKEINFILDHIDGDIFNNFRENLRLICPNCDSQLDTFKSKNKNSGRNYRLKYYNK